MDCWNVQPKAPAPNHAFDGARTHALPAIRDKKRFSVIILATCTEIAINLFQGLQVHEKFPLLVALTNDSSHTQHPDDFGRNFGLLYPNGVAVQLGKFCQPQSRAAEKHDDSAVTFMA